MSKELDVFEQSVARLPETGREVYEFVLNGLVAKTKHLSDEIVQYTDLAGELKITDALGIHEATELLQRKKMLEGKIAEELILFKDKAHKLHKGVCAAIDVLQKPLDGVERNVKQAMRTWTLAEEARIAKERRDAEEKARLEHERLIKAAQAKIDTAIGKIEDLDGKILEAEKVLAAEGLSQDEHDVYSAVLQGLLDRKAGLVTKVQAMAAPPVPRAIPQAPEPEKIAGLSSKKVWAVEVVDLGHLIMAVNMKVVAQDVLEPSMSKLKKLANSGGVPTSRGLDGRPGIPGCRLTEDLSFTVRG